MRSVLPIVAHGQPQSQSQEEEQADQEDGTGEGDEPGTPVFEIPRREPRPSPPTPPGFQPSGVYNLNLSPETNTDMSGLDPSPLLVRSGSLPRPAQEEARAPAARRVVGVAFSFFSFLKTGRPPIRPAIGVGLFSCRALLSTCHRGTESGQAEAVSRLQRPSTTSFGYRGNRLPSVGRPFAPSRSGLYEEEEDEAGDVVWTPEEPVPMAAAVPLNSRQLPALVADAPPPFVPSPPPAAAAANTAAGGAWVQESALSPPRPQPHQQQQQQRQPPLVPPIGPFSSREAEGAEADGEFSSRRAVLARLEYLARRTPPSGMMPAQQAPRQQPGSSSSFVYIDDAEVYSDAASPAKHLPEVASRDASFYTPEASPAPARQPQQRHQLYPAQLSDAENQLSRAYSGLSASTWADSPGGPQAAPGSKGAGQKQQRRRRQPEVTGSPASASKAGGSGVLGSVLRVASMAASFAAGALLVGAQRNNHKGEEPRVGGEGNRRNK